MNEPRSVAERIPWWALPLAIAFFGSACSLLSRTQTESGHAGFVMIAVGVAVSYLFGLVFVRRGPVFDDRLVGELIIAATVTVVCAVVSLVVARDTIGFAFTHILLTFGMACQLASWVMFTKRAQEQGFREPAAFGLGLAVCIAGPLFAEAVHAGLGLLAIGARDGQTVGVCLVMLAAFASVALCLPQYLMPGEGTAGSGRTGAPGGEGLDDRLVLFASEYNLTQRERDVLCALVRGATTSQIARQLDVTSGTVKTHVSHLYQKLGVSSRTEVVALFERAGEDGDMAADA